MEKLIYRQRLLNPTPEEVILHIEAQCEKKTDRIIDATRVTALHEFVIRYCENYDRKKKFDFTRSAFNQLLNRVAVPLQFYDRCPPGLQTVIFHEFVTKAVDKRYLFRQIADPDLQVRAALSNKYCKIDDHEVFPIVFKALKDEDIIIDSFAYDDRISQLLIRFEDTECHYQGTDMVAGLQVSNSETGHAAVWLEPVVTIPSCSFVNRRGLKTQGAELRIVHKGEVNPQRIQDMTKQAKDIAQVGIIQLADAWTKRVKPAYALSYAKAIDGLPKRMHDILKEEWEKEEDLIKAEVARRIMLLAKELPLFKRIPVQQSAGGFLGLFNNYKARIGAIMEEIE